MSSVQEDGNRHRDRASDGSVPGQTGAFPATGAIGTTAAAGTSPGDAARRHRESAETPLPGTGRRRRSAP